MGAFVSGLSTGIALGACGVLWLLRRAREAKPPKSGPVLNASLNDDDFRKLINGHTVSKTVPRGTVRLILNDIGFDIMEMITLARKGR